MTPLFPQWMDSWLRVVLGAIVGLIILVPVLLMAYVRSPGATGERQLVSQPVEFDHRHHVADDGIDCLYCHYEADRSAYAGIPGADTCMGCHGQIWPDSPLLELVQESALTGEPIPWRRVHDVPDFVYFDHAAHVRRGVGCASCHGPVEQMAQVMQVEPLTMRWCVDCHRDPDPELRPAEYVTDTQWRPDRPRREVGEEIRREQDIDPPLHCSACHY